MQPAPPCPAPACWWQTQVTGLVLHWQLRILWVFFPLSQLCCPLRFPTDPPVRGFPTVWKLLLLPAPSPGQVSIPNSFVSFSFIFCPTSYRREWAAFLGAWCPPPAFRSCFVEFPQLQMIFWWICGGESGLPGLFLCHLRTAPMKNWVPSFKSTIFEDFK